MIRNIGFILTSVLFSWAAFAGSDASLRMELESKGKVDGEPMEVKIAVLVQDRKMLTRVQTLGAKENEEIVSVIDVEAGETRTYFSDGKLKMVSTLEDMEKRLEEKKKGQDLPVWKEKGVKKVDGETCRVFVKNADKGTAQMCMKEDAILYDLFDEFCDRWSRFSQNLGWLCNQNISAKAFNGFKGYPIEMVVTGPEEEPGEMHTKITTFETGAIDPAEFQEPKGYQEFQKPSAEELEKLKKLKEAIDSKKMKDKKSAD